MWVRGAESSNEVVFLRSNCALSCISTMHNGWHELEVDFLLFHQVFENCAVFVVETLESGVKAAADEESVNAGVNSEDFLCSSVH